MNYKKYLEEDITPILRPVILNLLKTKPENPVEQMIKFMLKNKGKPKNVILEEEDEEEEEENYENCENENNSILTDRSDDLLTQEDLNIKFKYKNKEREWIIGDSYNIQDNSNNELNDIEEHSELKNNISVDLRNIILNLFENYFFLNNLNDTDKNQLIDKLEEIDFKKNEIIIYENEIGDCLYIVKEGDLDCYKKFDEKEELVKSYKQFEIFGENSLLYNTSRKATIKCRTDASLYKLTRKTFNKIVRNNLNLRNENIIKIFNEIEIFKKLDEYEKRKILESMNEMKFREGEYIFKEGDVGSEFYIILNGEAISEKFKNGNLEFLCHYKNNDYLGELSLLNNNERQYSLKVISKTIELLSINRKNFNRLIGSIENVLNRNTES